VNNVKKIPKYNKENYIYDTEFNYDSESEVTVSSDIEIESDEVALPIMPRQSKRIRNQPSWLKDYSQKM
jgi:hypothetical protein